MPDVGGQNVDIMSVAKGLIPTVFRTAIFVAGTPFVEIRQNARGRKHVQVGLDTRQELLRSAFRKRM